MSKEEMVGKNSVSSSFLLKVTKDIQTFQRDIIENGMKIVKDGLAEKEEEDEITLIQQLIDSNFNALSEQLSEIEQYIKLRQDIQGQEAAQKSKTGGSKSGYTADSILTKHIRAAMEELHDKITSHIDPSIRQPTRESIDSDSMVDDSDINESKKKSTEAGNTFPLCMPSGQIVNVEIPSKLKFAIENENLLYTILASDSKLIRKTTKEMFTKEYKIYFLKKVYVDMYKRNESKIELKGIDRNLHLKHADSLSIQSYIVGHSSSSSLSSLSGAIDMEWPLLFLSINEHVVNSVTEDAKEMEAEEKDKIKELDTERNGDKRGSIYDRETADDLVLRRDIYRRTNRAGLLPIVTATEALALVVHTLLLRDNFTCIFHEPPSKNGPKGFAPPTRLISADTFVPPKWNIDPLCITLTYRPPANSTVNATSNTSQSTKLLHRNQNLIDEVCIIILAVEEDFLLQFQEKKKKQEPLEKRLTVNFNEYFKGSPSLLGFPFCMHSLDRLHTLFRETFLIPSYYPDATEIKSIEERQNKTQTFNSNRTALFSPRNHPWSQRDQLLPQPVRNPYSLPDFHGDLIPGVGGGNLMGPTDPFFAGQGLGGHGLGFPRPRFDPYGPPPINPAPDPNDPRYRGAYQPDPDHLPPPGVNPNNDLRRSDGRGGGRNSGNQGGGGFNNMYL